MREQSVSNVQSAYEHEFEFEMDDLVLESEFENDDLESMIEGEMDDQNEFEFALDNEFEADDTEFESDGVPTTSSLIHAERLFELAQYEFEAEDLDAELANVLNSVEQEYFWGALVKKIAKNPAVRNAAKGLISKGLKYAKKYVPHTDLLKAGTSLLRGDIKGALTPAMRAAVQALAPGAGTAALAVADSLGINPLKSESEQIEVLQGLVQSAEKAYEYAVENLHEVGKSPQSIKNLAAKSVQYGRNSLYKNWPQQLTNRQRYPSFSNYRPNPSGVRTVTLHQRPNEVIRKVVILIQ